jgi:hypothetical protein
MLFGMDPTDPVGACLDAVSAADALVFVHQDFPVGLNDVTLDLRHGAHLLPEVFEDLLA